MDWLTFIAKLVETLAWPAVALTTILLLRKPLGEWLSTLTNLKLKWSDWEGEFSRGLEEAKQTAERIDAPTTTTTTTPPPDYEPASEKYSRLIGVSPVAGITEAWRDIEIELQALGEKSGFPVNGKTPGALIDLARSNIDPETYDLLQRLRKLRNEAMHGRTTITAQQATEYSQLAVRALARLQTIISC